MKTEQAISPSLAEFRKACLSDFSFLTTMHGFRHVPEPVERYPDPFAVHFEKKGWTIVVRGLSYGFALDLEVHSPDGRRGSFGVLIPKGKAMEVRQGYQRGQLGDISSAARCLREYGEDFLRGEWSRFEEIDRFHLEIRRATHDAWQKEQKEAPLRHALEEADEAFRRQDYSSVVAVLSPFSENLSPTQTRKLEIAKKKNG
jgi:hypothetical protein